MTESETTTAVRTPRFNHVAMSVPADLLDAEGRAAILGFWGEVFGFEELPTETEDRRKLVLQAYDWEQFVFLIAADDPMRCPRLDHFGMSVATRAELETFYARARAYAEKDDRVDLVEQSVEDHHGVLQLHNFYVSYLLPMMIEIQFFDWDPAVAAMNPANGSAS